MVERFSGGVGDIASTPPAVLTVHDYVRLLGFGVACVILTTRPCIVQTNHPVDERAAMKAVDRSLVL